MKLTGKELVGVTGAAGFVGSHLARCLLRREFKVRLLVHRSPLPADIRDHPKIETVPGSINDGKTVEQFLQGVDILFHLASALGNRVIPEAAFFRINRDGTDTVMQAAARSGVKKVVHFSSAGVYGKTSGQIPLKESDPCFPIDVYERSKLAGEEAARRCADRLDISVIRPGWVYGEGDRRTFKLIKQIHSGPFFIAGSGRIKHSPIYIDDLTQTSLLVAERGKRGEVYNAGREVASVEEMVHTIAAVLGKKIFPLKVPMFLVYPPAFCLGKLFALFGREAPLNPARLAFFLRGKPLNSAKIKTQLGAVFQAPFEEGTKRAVAWYRQEGWL
jgi:nucleoside-diphosphate-sugar epimerase